MKLFLISYFSFGLVVFCMIMRLIYKDQDRGVHPNSKDVLAAIFLSLFPTINILIFALLVYSEIDYYKDIKHRISSIKNKERY